MVKALDVSKDITSGFLTSCIMLVMDEFVLRVWKKLSIGALDPVDRFCSGIAVFVRCRAAARRRHRILR
jgi:hypothetical protein